MGRLKTFFLVKIGPNPQKLAPRIKFVGIMEMLFAIFIGGYHVLKGNTELKYLVVPGLLFLIGIVTSYTGTFFEQLSTTESRLGINRDD